MTEQELEAVKNSVIRRFPINGNLAFAGLKIRLSNEIETAAVSAEKNKEGILEVKELIINPEFMGRLTYSEKVFVISHEILHIAFKHFKRSVKKPIKDAEEKYKEYCEKEINPNKREIMHNILLNKYNRIWNYATDACINSTLRDHGFAFPQNVIDPTTGEKMHFVDMPEGQTMSAEKIYDMLVKKMEEKEKNKEKQTNNSSNQPKQTSVQSNQGSMDNIDIDDIENYKGFDSHEQWNSGEEKPNLEDTEEDIDDIDEVEEINKDFQSNPKFKNIPKMSQVVSNSRGAGLLDDYNPKEVKVPWTRFLIGTLEKEEEYWSNRRASRLNPNARIGDRYIEDLPADLEILLDTSGSVSKELLKGFLNEIVPLFTNLYGNLRVKVGCFDNSFHGFTEIRSLKDLKNYNPTGGGGTNFEVAVTSFTKSRNSAKVIFTDGYAPQPTTKVNGVTWIIFGGNKEFKSVNGRVIYVSEEEENKMENDGLNLIEETYIKL